MCKRWHTPEPCRDYKCPHNLFWEGLKLNSYKIHETNKAVEIGNCCCLVNEPWTIEEIKEAWGLTGDRIRRCEEVARRKVLRANQC